MTEIVSRLSETPDDPARRPDLDDYQARAAELTPPDVSPEVRAQVSRMAAIEHAQADRAWQAARGRAAVAAVDWFEKNPATRLLAMPPELRLLMTTGFLGGLSTFSTFSGEIVTQLSHKEYFWSALTIAAHVMGSVVLTIVGIYAVRLVFPLEAA